MTQRTDDLSVRLGLALGNTINLRHSRLQRLTDILNSANPLRQLAEHRARCATLNRQLQNHLLHNLQNRKKQLDYLTRSLQTVSPLATLERGYAIVTDADDNIIRRADQLKKNAEISTRFSRGSIRSTVNVIDGDDE